MHCVRAPSSSKIPENVLTKYRKYLRGLAHSASLKATGGRGTCATSCKAVLFAFHFLRVERRTVQWTASSTRASSAGRKALGMRCIFGGGAASNRLSP